MAATDSIRVRVDPGFKDEVVRMYAQRGTTVSQAIRSFLADELASHNNALAAFDAIMASADAKVAASGMPEPTIEEIDEYIGAIRKERAEQALAG